MDNSISDKNRNSISIGGPEKGPHTGGSPKTVEALKILGAGKGYNESSLGYKGRSAHDVSTFNDRS